MKLTNKQIKQMKKLSKEGAKIREIAIKLKVSPSTVCYHVSKGMREKRIGQAVELFRNKTLEQRRKVYKRRAEYVKNYQRKKYNEDKIYKRKKQNLSREYYRKHSKPIEEVKGGKK